MMSQARQRPANGCRCDRYDAASRPRTALYMFDAQCLTNIESAPKIPSIATQWTGLMTTTADDLTRRAFAAYFRSGGNIQPANDSGLATHNGMQYVVLRNVSGVFAVYRVRNDGMLKGLKRWPAALE